jgi:hypothetical protein
MPGGKILKGAIPQKRKRGPDPYDNLGALFVVD